MTELNSRDRERLRNTLNVIDEQAPLAPDLDDLGTISVRPGQSSRPRGTWAVVAAFAVTLAILVPISLLDGDDGIDVRDVAPVPPADPLPSTTAVVPDEATDRLPLDGRPEDLGVDRIDFMTALFPTSPEEHRVTAAWRAVRFNVEQSWAEACMADMNVEADLGRMLAIDFRRNGQMPDFELDAELGITSMSEIEAGLAVDPSDMSEEWQETYSDCGSQIEARLSKEFDQVIGRAPSWWQIVQEVNASETMEPVTAQLLDCVAEGGGPVGDAVTDLYSTRTIEDAPDLTTGINRVNDLADLIHQCSGDYNQVRQELLIPERDRIAADYPDVLAEAKRYFDGVLRDAGLEPASSPGTMPGTESIGADG